MSVYFELSKLRGEDKNVCLIDYMEWVFWKDFPGFWKKNLPAKMQAKIYKYIWDVVF